MQYMKGTYLEAKKTLREQLKDLTPQQIIDKYSKTPFFELKEEEKDEVINAFKLKTQEKESNCEECRSDKYSKTPFKDLTPQQIYERYILRS